jgi:hypothetical protein
MLAASTARRNANMNIRTGVAALLVACCATSFAQEAPPPKVHKQGSSTYVTGGLTADDKEALFKVAPKYPIHLIFQLNGEAANVTGVRVRVKDTTGDVIVEAASEGPYMYVNPPSGGRFTIEAEYEGQKQAFTKDLVGRRYLVLEYKFTR